LPVWVFAKLGKKLKVCDAGSYNNPLQLWVFAKLFSKKLTKSLQKAYKKLLKDL